MSASNTFVLQSAERFAQARQVEVQRFLAEKHRLQDVHQQSLHALEQHQERYLAFVEPVLLGLVNLPEGLQIEAIHKNTSGEALVVLSANAQASMVSMLLEYPALPFVVLDSGKMREPYADAADQAIYDGVLIEGTKAEVVHWQSVVGGAIVHFSCRTNGISLSPWRNPADTGYPVASVALGDLPTSAWVQQGGYWAAPASDAAKALLDKAIVWRAKQQLSADVGAQFYEDLESIASLKTPKGKILASALLGWALTDQALPTAKDYLVWEAPRGNVVAMHGQQDWDNLLAGPSPAALPVNDVQEKIRAISTRLPNFWRFVDPSQVESVCDAMAAAQTRWLAAPSVPQPTMP